MENEEIKQNLEDPTPPAQEENFKDKYFRTLAEMENMRKRVQKEKQDMLRFGIDNAISDFLPIIDQFENALRFADSASSEVKNWAFGFQMILTQLQNALQSQGISPFSSEGTLFNPLMHEAVEMVETDEYSDGTIIQEFCKGYKSHMRVIRPSKVKVAKKPKENPAETVESPAEEQITN